MNTIEKLTERLQQLNLERINLSRSFDQITGAMIEIENQIKALQPEVDGATEINTATATAD
jgi:predicted nuclease with TOPRIM domain